jgi:hypothetical protein
MGFLFKDMTPYDLIRSKDPAEAFILYYFKFTVYELLSNYDALRRVLYGGAVSN